MSNAARSARIAAETFLSRAGADDAMTDLFSTIDDALASGKTERIAGFETFIKKNRQWNEGGAENSKTSLDVSHGDSTTRMTAPF